MVIKKSCDENILVMRRRRKKEEKNCDDIFWRWKLKKQKLLQNLNTQIVTKRKYSSCDKTQIGTKLQNQIVTKLNNSNCDKS